MPNIEELMDAFGQTISEKKTRSPKAEEIYLSTMDLMYAYGQLPLNQETSMFLLVDRKSTGTYRLKTMFYGLLTMPAELQRVMELKLANHPQFYAFIENILEVTKGSEIEQISNVEKIWRNLDKENMALKLKKFNFAQNECEWLEHRIMSTGVTPLTRKTEPIEALKPPRNWNHSWGQSTVYTNIHSHWQSHPFQ